MRPPIADCYPHPATGGHGSAGDAGVAAAALHVTWLEARGADRIEALHAATRGWCLGRSGHHVLASDVRVPVDGQHVIRGPACRAAAAAADKLEGHAERLWAGDLRALVEVAAGLPGRQLSAGLRLPQRALAS